MPNPFPGMDPYLEGPLWSSLHLSLIAEIARQLAPQLQPKYLALANTRIVLATLDPIELPRKQERLPDVGIYGAGTVGKTAGAVTVQAPLTLDGIMPEAIEQPYLEVRDVESQTLVTAIELLSPTNKRGDGLEEFRKKRRELLAGPAHYLEIDLLRKGKRFPISNTLPSVAYFVFLSRVDRRPRVDTWPIGLDQPLPLVPVPLLDGDPDVCLDLQLAWNTIYQLFSYDRAVNHSGRPVVPLSLEQQTWADECLRKAGLKT